LLASLSWASLIFFFFGGAGFKPRWERRCGYGPPLPLLPDFVRSFRNWQGGKAELARSGPFLIRFAQCRPERPNCLGIGSPASIPVVRGIFPSRNRGGLLSNNRLELFPGKTSRPNALANPCSPRTWEILRAKPEWIGNHREPAGNGARPWRPFLRRRDAPFLANVPTINPPDGGPVPFGSLLDGNGA